MSNFPVLTRHDNHNLEFKVLHELAKTQTSEIEISILFPSSIELSSGDKQRVFNDFLPRYKKVLGPDEFDAETTFSEVRVILSSDLHLIENQKRLKYLGALLQEQWRQLKSGLSFANPEALSLEKVRPLYEFLTQLNEARLTITRPRIREYSVLFLFEFYFHHLAIEFISKSKEVQTRLPEETAQILVLWEEFEAKRHLKILMANSLRGKEEEQEERLIQLSHAKKFFQSQMFIKSRRTDLSSRLAGPLATAGAIIAGLSSSILEQVSSPVFGAYRSGGIALVGIGIGLYTFRDRIKDQARTYLWSKLSAKLYDKQSKLIFKKLAVADAREWLTLEGSHKRDEMIQSMKEIDPAIGSKAYSLDDLMIYKKSIRVMKGFSGYIQEALRFNFERHLKHFDDRRKKLSYFSRSGELVTIKTHRVYNLYVCIRHLGVSQFYKVIMDKKGIDRVIPLPDRR